MAGSYAPPAPGESQTRHAVSPSGREVWVTVTGDDRLAVIKRLPGRWPEVIKARERGQSLDEIGRWAKVPPPCKPSCRFKETPSAEGLEVVADMVHLGPECLAWYVADCYRYIETELQDLANRRARLMP